MLAPFSSFPFQLLFNWLDTVGFSNSLVSDSIYFCFANFFPLVFSSHLPPTFVCFYVSALASRANVIIGRTVAGIINYMKLAQDRGDLETSNERTIEPSCSINHRDRQQLGI